MKHNHAGALALERVVIDQIAFERSCPFAVFHFLYDEFSPSDMEANRQSAVKRKRTVFMCPPYSAIAGPPPKKEG
jgi:hypothetical protein